MTLNRHGDRANRRRKTINALLSGSSPSARLLTASQPTLTKIAACEWVTAFAHDAIGKRAYTDWLIQAGKLRGLQGPPIRYTISAYRLPAGLTATLTGLEAATRRDPPDLHAEYAGLTGDSTCLDKLDAWPITESYGRYLQHAAETGACPAVAALLAATETWLLTWAPMRATVPYGTAHWDRVAAWSSQQYTRMVSRFADGFDDLAGDPGDEVLAELAGVFGQVVTFELYLWKQLWRGRRNDHAR